MSRLLENSERLRSNIEARNLFTPENPYTIDEGNVVRTINSLANIIAPFDSFDVTNTVLARLVGGNAINTPITRIGLAMLGKQFAATVRSFGSAEILPAINFTNLFDGNPDTKLFTRKVDLQITRRESQTNIGRIIEELTGNYRPINPFQDNPTPEEYFLQTGVGQQTFIISSINRNLYKKSDTSWLNAIQSEEFEYINPNPRIFFVGKNQRFYPFDSYLLFDVDSINLRLNNEFSAFRNSIQDTENYFEYGATQQYLDGLGRSDSRINSDSAGNYFIDPNNYGLNDNTAYHLIWGRDGVSSEYESDRNGFDQNPNENPRADGGTSTSSTFDGVNRFNNFSSGVGLLNYTKELLNSKGKFANFDLTKKKFVDREGNIFFNGSPHTIQPDGTVDRSRQHNVTDPYDRFVKAIRFDGNIRYNGNKNSVIHRSVIPKYHPVIDQEGMVNVKNLMFSIENLAAPVFKDEINSLAYLDDEFGTQVPMCEAGENGGRLMWFAPYDVQLSEQAIARHETTTFIGRGEPIYTYNNSERLATLSFKLLIDYPPQVKGLDHLTASRFFAFGGSGSTTPIININQAENELQNLIQQRDEITPEVDLEQPEINLPSPLTFYFPNDIPTVGGESNAVLNTISLGYEDGIVSNEIDGRDFGLNTEFISRFNDAVENVLSPDNRDFVDIEIVGEATQLFDEIGTGIAGENFNEQLGQRRADALREYLNDIYLDIYGRTLEQDGINVITRTLGQTRAPDTTSTVESIADETSKSFRNATITFIQNQNAGQRTQPLTTQQIQDREILNNEIRQLDTRIKKAKEQLQRGFECTFNQYTIEEGVFKGFRGTQINKFMPVFHSQTPEDFHRRLTFLHQCTRQGNAVRRTQEASDGVQTFSARNAVFGRQPIQVLRIGDFFHTKIVIDNISFDYADAPWDLNPEGHGMQFMYADITIQMKIIGGQSLATPIDALQNAVSFNYYANSTFSNNGIYQTATRVEDEQLSVRDQIIQDTQSGILDRNDEIRRKIEANSQGQI